MRCSAAMAMTALTIAAAQTLPTAGARATEHNVADHVELLRVAASHRVELVVFPELSVTGYELELADALAFSPGDPRLDPLRRAASALGVIAIVGAPLRLETGLHIAALALLPSGDELAYTKRHVHASEARVFVPGALDPRIQLAELHAALAICADTSFPSHAQRAASSGAALYLAGSCVTGEDYPRDEENLRGYAASHAITVAMANYGGRSGTYDCVGGSAVWAPGGELVARAPRSGRALIVARRVGETWRGEVLRC